MAEVVAAQVPPTSGTAPTGLQESQREALEQFARILRFKNEVLDGKYPSPAPTATSSAVPSAPAAPPTTAVHESTRLENSNAFTSNSQQQGLPATSLTDTATSGSSTVKKTFGSGRTEINPILLEKSDELIRAELQLRRQRIERSIREEIEQRRAVKNATQGDPSSAELDLSDVLSKALTLVQATAAPGSSNPAPADETVPAANQDAASDSFDDNTFYSSRHDTPDSRLTSRVPNESEELQASVPTEVQQPAPVAQTVVPGLGQLQPTSHQNTRETIPSINIVGGNATTNYQDIVRVPGLGSYVNDGVVSSGPSQITPTEQSRSEESVRVEVVQQQDIIAPQGPRNAYNDDRPPSPLIRAHELSPVAPQPSHISSLAVAARPSRDPIPAPAAGTPAQVAALRGEPVAVTSPDSSPSGGRASDNKKKGKKKKRKADKQALEAERTPYIKPEPGSASPMNAPPYIRPNKRQKYTQSGVNEASRQEVSYEHSESLPQETSYSSRPLREERIPVGYERRSVLSSHRSSTMAVAGGTPYASQYVDERPIARETYYVRESSAYAHPETVLVRSADPGSHIRAQGRVASAYEPSRPQRTAYESGRLSVRPEAEVYMAPPRPPTRIVVDQFGREYIEPPRQTIIRQSAAPSVRHGDPEIIYERTAPRAVSRHVGLEAYEDGGSLYHRSPPQYAMPRRVVTQPEYSAIEYHEPGQREYSTRSIARAGEFVEVMAPPERRHVEAAPVRDFVTRAASMRPAEPVRYEMPREYGRVQSVRPEVPARQYAASVHPESRVEAAQPPYLRDYEVRPVVEPAVVRQEYNMVPVERYYEQPVLEAPRGATQEVLYAEDVREAYR